MAQSIFLQIFINSTERNLDYLLMTVALTIRAKLTDSLGLCARFDVV